MNVSPTNSKILYGTRSTAKNDGEDSIIVCVRLRDHDNNPVPGRVVELIADKPEAIITQPATPTDATGLAIGSVRSTEAGAVIVTARVYPPNNSSASSS